MSDTTTTGAKERPILFSGPMVKAILDGRKTQTRRVVKDIAEGPGGWPSFARGRHHGNMVKPKYCPYGTKGDRLWVREMWAGAEWTEDTWMGGRELEEWSGPIPKSRPPGLKIGYRADGDDFETKWRPSIFMPRWASRITLEITGVRAERLHQISEAGAAAEGCDGDCPVGYIPAHAAGKCSYHFAQLWDGINGERPGCSWIDNPWVWVIEFRRVDS